MSRHTNSFLIFVAGAAAGAMLGILYAPDKGIHTRDRLTFQLGRYRDQLRELTDQLMDQKNQLHNPAKSEGQRVIKDAREKAERLLGDVEELIGQIKSRK